MEDDTPDFFAEISHARKKPLRGFLVFIFILIFYTLGFLRGISEGIERAILYTREARD